MKSTTILKLKIIIAIFLGCSIQSFTQNIDDVSGVYSTTLRTNAGLKLTNIELYQQQIPIYQQYTRISNWISIYVRITQYDNRKKKGSPIVSVYCGRIEKQNNEGFCEVDLKSIKKDTKTGKMEFVNGKDFSFKKNENGTLQIKSYGLDGTYDKTGGNEQRMDLIKYISEIRLGSNISRGYLNLGNINPVKDNIYGYQQKSGIFIYMNQSQLNKYFLRPEIHASYKVKRNSSARQSKSNIEIANGLIPQALRNMPGKGYVQTPLQCFPNIERLILHDSESGEEHFIVTITIENGRAKLIVNKTPIAQKIQDDYLAHYNELHQEQTQYEKEKLSKTEEYLKNKEFNPSKVALNINYNKTGESAIIPEEIQKVFYGEFEKVDRSLFKNRLHNIFLWYASDIYGSSYSSDNVKKTFTIEWYEEDVFGIKSLVGTDNYEIWMQPRFVNSYDEYFDENQFALINAIFWGYEFKKIFEKYPANSPMFKQLLENVYRYSAGLPPVKTMDELNRVLKK